MKQLLMIVMLSALVSSCSKPAAFRGSIRDLVPKQVADFRLKGEVKAVDIAPTSNYQEGALRPTEGVMAQYETPGKGQLSLQVINYPSAADASKAFKETQENVSKLGNGAKLSEGTRTSGQHQAIRKIVVEGIAPGFSEIIWVDGSLLYQVAGDNLNAILDFEKNLP